MSRTAQAKKNRNKITKKPSAGQSESGERAQPSAGQADSGKRKIPPTVTDLRFLKERGHRQYRCDNEECPDRYKKMKKGHDAGAFYHRKNLPKAGNRKSAWESGEWDATWYCTQCYMSWWDCTKEQVMVKLKFAPRAEKKAKYVQRNA